MNYIENRPLQTHNIPLLLFLILPIAILSGPFFSDLIVVLISSFFLINSFFLRDFSFVQSKFFKFFFIFYFYILLRSIFSLDPLLSLESSLFYFRFGFFALAISYLVQYQKNFLNIFHIFLYITVFFVCADALFQFVSGENFFGIKKTDFQVPGIFGEEQILGSYLYRLFPILIAYVFLRKKIHFKMYPPYTLIFILVTSCVILSGERTAIFLYFLEIILIFIFTNTNKKFQIVNLSLSFVVFLILILSSDSIRTRVVYQTFNQVFGVKTENLSENNISLSNINNLYFFSNHHTAHYKSALKMFKSNIVFGKGPKMFRYLCSQDEFYIEQGCSTHPHNYYIQLLAELGLIGFLIFFCIFIYLIFILIKIKISHFKKNIIYDDYTIILLILILINLFPLTPSGNFFNNKILLYFYLPIGFLFAHLSKSKNSL